MDPVIIAAIIGAGGVIVAALLNLFVLLRPRKEPPRLKPAQVEGEQEPDRKDSPTKSGTIPESKAEPKGQPEPEPKQSPVKITDELGRYDGITVLNRMPGFENQLMRTRITRTPGLVLHTAGSVLLGGAISALIAAYTLEEASDLWWLAGLLAVGGGLVLLLAREQRRTQELAKALVVDEMKRIEKREATDALSRPAA